MIWFDFGQWSVEFFVRFSEILQRIVVFVIGDCGETL